MKFTKEQQDYLKHCGEHFEVLTGGRGHSKTKEVIEDMQQKIDRLNNIIDELEKWLNEAYEYLLFTDTNRILRNSKEQMDKYGYFHDLGSINDVVNFLEKVKEKLKELKEKYVI